MFNMIQKEKQLLLQELCAMLPYRVIAYASEITKNGIITNVNILYNVVNLTVDNASGNHELVPLVDIKPYLRSIDNISDKESNEMEYLLNRHNIEDFLDFVHSHYIDWRNLIEKRLALEAPKDMYKITV